MIHTLTIGTRHEVNTAAVCRRPRRCEAVVSAILAATAMFASLAPAALAAPDLVVQSVSVDPSTGANGSSVHVTAEVRNQGSSGAAASVTRIRINQSSTSVTTTDPILCSIQTPSIDAGASTEVGCTTTVSSRPPGQNFIWAIADARKDIGQENTANDRSSTSFTVSSESPPDLVVQAISLAPTTLKNGDELSIGVTVKNIGQVAAAASTTRIRINQDPATVASTDPVLCNLQTPALSPGQSVEAGCTPTISSRPGGTNYVWAIADVNRSSGQTNTTNDRTKGAIQVSDQASDLVVDSVTVDPEIGANGKSIQITATIRNQGIAAAPGTVTRVRINQDPNDVASTDTVLCSGIQTDGIEPGESIEVSCKPTLSSRPPGTNYIWVVADSTNVAGQSDRTNDKASVAIEIDPSSTPDLTIRSLTISPNNAAIGETVTVTARVGNDGKIGAPATKTRFVVNQNPEGIDPADPVLCDQVNTVALDDGSSVLISCKAKVPVTAVGPSFVWAFADATGLAGEGNRENNTRSVELDVEPGIAPDLVVENVLASPPAATSGEDVTLTVRVRNQGSAAALASTANIRVSTNADGAAETDPIVCDAMETPAIAAGAVAETTCTWTVTGEAGTVYLWAAVDLLNTAGQHDRTNDAKGVSFLVLPGNAPDLVIRRLSVDPATAQNGQTITVRARVTNTGNRAAAASVTTFRINQNRNDVTTTDAVLCAARPTPSLAAGATARIRCTATLHDRPVGENVVWAIADTGATSGQFNTTNDRRRTTLQVTTACTDPSAAPVMTWPIDEPRIVQDYASYGSVPLARGKLGYHSGIDLVSHLDIPTSELVVHAAADGEVVAVRKACPSPADATINPPNGVCLGGWGNFVLIRHGDGIFSIYAHLGDVSADLGCIAAGDPIGVVGSSGSTKIPPHLHFDVMSDLASFGRTAFGAEYYRTLHPALGRTPENDDGTATTHLDARDFMTRTRIKLAQNAVASRAEVIGGQAVYFARGQELLSYGELVPGFYLVDVPYAVLPEDGPAYADDARYAWLPVAKATVVATDVPADGDDVARIDGVVLFDVGADFASLRAQASPTSAEVSRAWGGQQYVEAGAPVVAGGTTWQPVFIAGTAASGAGKPRIAWVDSAFLSTPVR